MRIIHFADLHLGVENYGRPTEKGWSSRMEDFLIAFDALVDYALADPVYAEDDAYIHFRIARNFAQYDRPYFNLNEPVYATSAISWTLLVAFLFKIFGPLPKTVAVVNS